MRCKGTKKIWNMQINGRFFAEMTENPADPDRYAHPGVQTHRHPMSEKRRKRAGIEFRGMNIEKNSIFCKK